MGASGERLITIRNAPMLKLSRLPWCARYFSCATREADIFVGESQRTTRFFASSELLTMVGRMAQIEFSNGRNFRKCADKYQRFRCYLSGWFISNSDVSVASPRVSQFAERWRSVFWKRHKRLVFWFQIARFINANGTNRRSNARYRPVMMIGQARESWRIYWKKGV